VILRASSGAGVRLAVGRILGQGPGAGRGVVVAQFRLVVRTSRTVILSLSLTLALTLFRFRRFLPAVHGSLLYLCCRSTSRGAAGSAMHLHRDLRSAFASSSDGRYSLPS